MVRGTQYCPIQSYVRDTTRHLLLFAVEKRGKTYPPFNSPNRPQREESDRPPRRMYFHKKSRVHGPGFFYIVDITTQSELAEDILGVGNLLGGDALPDPFHPLHGFGKANTLGSADPF